MDTKHSFRVNTLLSFCKSVDITYNVSGNPPTPQKITHACIACLCFYKVSNRKKNWGGGSGGGDETVLSQMSDQVVWRD